MRANALLSMTATIMSLTASLTMQVWGGSAPVTGSAGESGNVKDAARQLVQCSESVGTIALVESQIPALAQKGLTSPVPLIRLIAAQSRCFDVVDRGQALTRMDEERRLAEGGRLRQGANVGGGQMVAADYMITPNVVFSEGNAGAMRALGSALGSRLIPGMGSMGSALIGGISFKEAQAVMMVTDTRSGVQVAVAEGRAEASDLGGLGLGSINGFGSLDGYSTNEGKVVAGAFLDAFNKLVDQIRARASR
jgi:hypothetical protein